MTKYFKKVYEDGRPACGIWNDGDAINYIPSVGAKYIVEFINESEYNILKLKAKEYFSKKNDINIK